MQQSHFELKKYPNFEKKAYEIGIRIDELKVIIVTNIDLMQIWADRIETLDFTYELRALENAYKLFFHEVRNLIEKKEKDILVNGKHPANTALPSDPISLNLVPT